LRVIIGAQVFTPTNPNGKSFFTGNVSGNLTPTVLGDPHTARVIFLSESAHDLYAVADRSGLWNNPEYAFVATWGASNTAALEKIPWADPKDGAVVVLLRQYDKDKPGHPDKANIKWAAKVTQIIGLPYHDFWPHPEHKDWNDQTHPDKGGIDAKDLQDYLNSALAIKPYQPKPPGPQLPPVDDGDAIMQSNPVEPPILIEGILHKSLKMQLAGTSKAMKSWLVLHIAVCVATGTTWLGRKVNQARVFFLNLEVPKWHFDERLRVIVNALGVKLEKGMFNAWSLRGYDLADDNVWDAVEQRIVREGNTGLVVADPLYKLFNEKRGENETGATTAIMRRFDLLAERSGASPFFTHHYAKGSPVGKEAIDRFSGSGVLARDPDAYIAMTRHEHDDAFALDFSLRCLPPIDPFVIRWDYPLFKLDPALDPKDLHKPAARGKKAIYSVQDLVDVLGRNDLSTTEFKERCDIEVGMKSTVFYELLKKAKDQGLIHKSKVDDKWEVVQKKQR
jgi:hypothetical protein